MIIQNKKPIIAQENHYYPFGLNMAGIEKKGSPDHKFQYQGKELQPELTTYDFHARMYDPVLGRTFQQDPMSEMFYGYSSYSCVKNNPLNRVDPTGMTDFTLNKKTGEINEVVYDNEKEQAASEATSHVTLGTYENNSHKENEGGHGHVLGLKQGLNLTGFFHTHPTGAGICDSDRLVPSDQDLKSRNRALRMMPNMRF